MAREGRDGQGLQIAVIVFAMLTIILAVTTYIFYAQGQTALKEKADAQAATAAKQDEANKLAYKVRAMQQVLGLGGVGDAEVQLAKSNAGGEDPEVTDLLNNFKNDMALVADQAAATEARNYRTLPTILINVINKRSQSVTDANAQTRDTQAKSAAALAATEGRAKSFEDAAAKAKTDNETVLADYSAARTAMEGKKQELDQQLAAQRKKATDDADKATKALQEMTTLATTRGDTVKNLNARLKELEIGQVDLFENPDGKITWINQKQRLVWLNVGRADGLMRQTTFSVYDHDENGVANAKSKGRIEVVEISDDHLAEARILEDSPANPILPGDIIHTPSWSPGQRIHFAMAGKMDINHDGLDDYELVKNVIKLNGGVIDAELKPDGTRSDGKLSVNTSYLVLGDPPDEREGPDSTKMLAEYTKIRDEITRYGIDIIPVQKLLSLMGWKSEERTVELAGSRGGGEFRKRVPGKTAPATTATPGAAAPPTTTPAPTTTPMPGGAVDPFAAPGAPATTPPPAADPFAAPATGAPKAAPAAPAVPPAADPFGTPPKP